MKPIPIEARRVVALLYVAAAIVILEELAEVFALTYPFHPEVASWRFGLLGISVNRMGNIALADVMILTAGVFLEHRAFLRIAGIIHLIAAVLLVPLMVMLGLDALVLRRAIKPEFVRGFDLTAARTLLSCLIGFGAGVLVFWSTLRLRPPGAEKREAARSVLLTGSPAKESE